MYAKNEYCIPKILVKALEDLYINMLDVARNWIGQLKRSSSSASSKPIEYMVWSYYVDYYKKIIDLAKLGSVLAWAFHI